MKGTIAISLLFAVIAVTSAPAIAQPTKADCDQASKAIPSGDEILRMNQRQKDAAKVRLEASQKTLKECLAIATEESLKKATAIIESAAQDCARRGPPKIGMTPAELVETCWRRPTRIVKKTTAAGIEENYVYGIGHVVKFTDGKVSEIVEAR